MNKLKHREKHIFEIISIVVERWNRIHENGIDAIHIVREEIEKVNEQGWKLEIENVIDIEQEIKSRNRRWFARSGIYIISKFPTKYIYSDYIIIRTKIIN